jgi:three-Cys-motif partner protein
MEIAHPHSIKKFELIEAYVKVWAQKLLNTLGCDGIVFIDCMSNSGIYQDEKGKTVFGTPIRVANYLSDVMKTHPEKQAKLYFNDISSEKIEELKKHLPPNTSNFTIITSVLDGNILLKEFKFEPSNYCYLVVYDPYDASIDWFALMPFINTWGDVIINHMVNDTIRAVPQVKKPSAIDKYEHTYLTDFQELSCLGSDRVAYEKKVLEIIHSLRGNSSSHRYYIASFPFFNSKNTIVYELLLGTSSVKGFKAFKKFAWQTFGGKSSAKKTYGKENQFMIDPDNETLLTTYTDENCYYPKDIANYLHKLFIDQEDVPVKKVWAALDEHPVFPSDGFRTEVRECLKTTFGDKVAHKSISFTGKK